MLLNLRLFFFFRYEKYTTENNEKAYGVIGLATVYEYYAYPDNIRPRISQFLVLPPFQKRGLAVHLLTSINKFYENNDAVVDITGKTFANVGFYKYLKSIIRKKL